MGKLKKIGISNGIVIGGFFLISIISFLATYTFEVGSSEPEQNTQRTFEEDLSFSVFDLNYCPNQGKIVGEMWFSHVEFITVPVQAIINYEISSPDKLIQIGKMEISKDDFRNWTRFGNEMYSYDFQIPAESDVNDKDIIFTVTLDNGDNLVYEDKIKHTASLDNCKFS